MRLIDADALIAKPANIAKTFARSDAQKSLMGRVMFNTEKAPTIDAIPVEWLMDMANRGDFVYGAVVRWKYEQEVQHVGPQATHD